MAAHASETIPASLPIPAPGEVEIWWSPIDVGRAALERAAEAVDPGTLARAGAMRRDADRRRTLLAHALLRRVLGAVTGTAAPSLVLDRRCAACEATDHGRPYLPGGPSFGLSHGGDLVVIALAAPGSAVAVDVEDLQPADRWESVRRHAFSDEEWEQTAGDPERERTALWVRKEAVVKATGHGLSLSLTRVHVGAPQEAGARTVQLEAGTPAAPEGPWFAADLQLAPDHCAAVAMRDSPPTITAVRLAGL